MVAVTRLLNDKANVFVARVSFLRLLVHTVQKRRVYNTCARVFRDLRFFSFAALFRRSVDVVSSVRH